MKTISFSDHYFEIQFVPNFPKTDGVDFFEGTDFDQ